MKNSKKDIDNLKKVEYTFKQVYTKNIKKINFVFETGVINFV